MVFVRLINDIFQQAPVLNLTPPQLQGRRLGSDVLSLKLCFHGVTRSFKRVIWPVVDDCNKFVSIVLGVFLSRKYKPPLKNIGISE